MRWLTLGSTAKNSGKSSGTGTQGPELSILTLYCCSFTDVHWSATMDMVKSH